MKKFKMKPETKEKLQKAWIDASPYITPVAVFLGGILYVYSKGVDTSNENYRHSLERRDEAYEAMADRTASAVERFNENTVSIMPIEEP